jgi:hypothetical protein
MGYQFNPFTGNFDQTGSGEIPTNVSQLVNDAYYISTNSSVTLADLTWGTDTDHTHLNSDGSISLPNQETSYLDTTYNPVADGTIAIVSAKLYVKLNGLWYNLRSIDASQITSGTISSSRLPSNLAAFDGANTFSQNQTFSGTANTAPNQTAASGSSLMTRDLSDARYSIISAYKNSSQIDSTTSAWVDVTGMTGISLLANTIYKVEFLGRITAATNATFAAQLVSSQNLGLSSGFYSGILFTNGVSNAIPASSATTIGFSTRAGAVTGVGHGAIFSLITGSSAPTVKLQISNTGTSGNTASLLANSVITFTKLA